MGQGEPSPCSSWRSHWVSVGSWRQIALSGFGGKKSLQSQAKVWRMRTGNKGGEQRLRHHWLGDPMIWYPKRVGSNGDWWLAFPGIALCVDNSHTVLSPFTKLRPNCSLHWEGWFFSPVSTCTPSHPNCGRVLLSELAQNRKFPSLMCPVLL